MASLPEEKAPKKDSDGEVYRRKQMMTQLPAHDNDDRFCDSLTDEEKQRMKDFLQHRNEKAVGIGEVGELADTKEASKFEMQQRALMLKRLSFAVFSSEADQYQSSLPEMQERLAECLRMPQVPVLHEQVFLFFRVLLVRMSDNMTSIWPMIISEMIHVFLLMESDLLQSDTPSRDQQMFYSETVLGASGYVNYSQDKWLGLYLAVCKLLDMALCLPPEQLPQFQMYRWAFEGSANDVSNKDHVSSLGTMFTPYVNRIAKLLAKRKNIYVSSKTPECHVGRPLLTMYQLESVDQLLPFLRLLSTQSRIILDMRNGEKSRARKAKGTASRNFIERLIERDFLEPLKE